MKNIDYQCFIIIVDTYIQTILTIIDHKRLNCNIPIQTNFGGSGITLICENIVFNQIASYIISQFVNNSLICELINS